MPRRQQSKRRREARLPARKLTRSWHEVEDDEGFLAATPPAPQPLISHPPLTPLPSHPPDGSEQTPSWLDKLARVIARWLSKKPKTGWP